MNNVKELAQSYRELADWMENADLPEESWVDAGMCVIFSYSKEDFSQCVKALGSCKKSATYEYLNADKRFGKIRLQATIGRNVVCEKIKIGTRIVPAKEATEETVEDVYEWDCPDSFLDGK